MSEPRVSAIIANWNGAEHLRICLPSLQSQSFTSLEIIVVDNCSSDDSVEVARSFGVRFLPLEKNRGLAPALNRGASTARGDFLLFVNNDMRFDSEFVAKLVEPLDRDQALFATDGMQFNWDGNIKGHMAARLSNAPSTHGSSAELVPGLYFSQRDEVRESPVFMASAACMMVRRTSFEQLGRFDDRLPLGYEDVEICWRAWLRNKKILYVPQAICWHRIGSSQQSVEGARLAFRGVLMGRLLLATKLLPWRYVVRTWLVSTVGLARDLSQLRWRFVIDRIWTFISMIQLQAQLLRERRKLFRYAGVSPEALLSTLLSLTGSDGKDSVLARSKVLQQ